MQYDLIVIGGGPGGYTGAIRAAKMGLKTAIIESRDFGGTCLNRGCIPTKTLLHSSELFASRTEWQAFGITAENVSINEQSIYERKDKIVNQLRGGVENLLRANGVEKYNAKGFIKDKNTVQAGEDTLTTKHILVATGSRPASYSKRLPIEGLDDTLNSDSVLESPVTAQKIVIIGGGVIAIEFASYFLSLGRDVTCVLVEDRILHTLSTDISSQLGLTLKRKGLKIINSARVVKLFKDKAIIEKNGEEVTLDGTVISAVGRAPNTEGLGLENAGVKFDRFIPVDNNMRTNIDNIFACGDVTGGIQLAHYAAASAITAVETMCGVSPSIDLSVCPSCIYTQPEIALVGKTTADEGDKVGKFVMGANGKSVVDGLNRGYVKIIADSSGVIKGGELFCLRATDMIGEVALCVQKGLSAHEAAAVIHPHPTVMEAVGEAFEDVFGMATHALPKKQ